MHNYTLANTVTRESKYRNALTLENCVNAAMYNYWVPAKDLELVPGAVVPVYYTADRTWIGEPAHWELPKAAGNMTLNYYMRRMPEWQSGLLTARGHYGVDTTGGNVVWGISFHPVTADTAFAGGFSVFGKAVPAAISLISTIELSASTATNTYCSINNTNIGAILQIQRRPTNAADTNLGDVRLYGVEIIYTEGRRDTGNQFVPGQRPLA